LEPLARKSRTIVTSDWAERERSANRLCIPTAFGRGYIGARTYTTQQSGQTSVKEVEIKNITVYVNGYTGKPDSRGRSHSSRIGFSLAADIHSNVFDLYFFIWSLSRLLCCVGSGSNVALALAISVSVKKKTLFFGLFVARSASCLFTYFPQKCEI